METNEPMIVFKEKRSWEVFYSLQKEMQEVEDCLDEIMIEWEGIFRALF